MLVTLFKQPYACNHQTAISRYIQKRFIYILLCHIPFYLYLLLNICTKMENVHSLRTKIKRKLVSVCYKIDASCIFMAYLALQFCYPCKVDIYLFKLYVESK